MKKLQKGRGKYKGNLPFKCFECGKIGHFASKCPYKENRDSGDDEDHEEKKNMHRGSRPENKRLEKSIL